MTAAPALSRQTEQARDQSYKHELDDIVGTDKCRAALLEEIIDKVEGLDVAGPERLISRLLRPNFSRSSHRKRYAEADVRSPVFGSGVTLGCQLLSHPTGA
ncbi:hypothetical protein [Sphingomonas guangdongensis]|uniref:hypothetical protein n=1 Tax=Sphingomonas guangdongensis TaxID=1141890 RepID=UPI001181BBFF|nr:hypothetical protein [Sphingomonas guangdongensis]